MGGESLQERYSAGELFELDASLQEARSHVIPRSSSHLLQEDGSLRVAIIRPCISRGKKIKGLPPIYTPRMLAENAAVFTDWPMYEDHLAEEAVEKFSEQLVEANMGDVLEFLQERARRIKEIGGRIDKSYWDPEVVYEDDASYGFQKGAVVGKVIPQPRVLEMLEADAKILNVSINAWPSGARPGTAPWDASARGMLIEGIRPTPRGSVDWVFRGGAGGRLLLEEGDAKLAVSVLEAFYSADHGSGPLHQDPELMDKLKNLKPDQLKEFLEEEAPHLVEALAPESAGGDKGSGGGTPLTEEALKTALQEQADEFESKLKERDERVEEEAERLVEEREALRTYSDSALELIQEAEKNGLPVSWANNLRLRYKLLPSGPGVGLQSLQEEEREVDGKTVTLSEEKVLEERVRADVAECVKLIEDAGGRVPRLAGLGGGAGGDDGEGKRPAPKQSAFRDFMRESGDFTPADPEQKLTEDDAIGGLIEEGVRR